MEFLGRFIIVVIGIKWKLLRKFCSLWCPSCFALVFLMPWLHSIHSVYPRITRRLSKVHFIQVLFPYMRIYWAVTHWIWAISSQQPVYTAMTNCHFYTTFNFLTLHVWIYALICDSFHLFLFYFCVFFFFAATLIRCSHLLPPYLFACAFHSRLELDKKKYQVLLDTNYFIQISNAKKRKKKKIHDTRVCVWMLYEYGWFEFEPHGSRNEDMINLIL